MPWETRHCAANHGDPRAPRAVLAYENPMAKKNHWHDDLRAPTNRMPGHNHGD